MNNIKDKLDLLAKSSKFVITERTPSRYDVSFKEWNYNDDYKEICATVNTENREISYYMADLYDNSNNFEEIDMKRLNELIKYCQLLIGE